jgi:hypothetical protein
MKYFLFQNVLYLLIFREEEEEEETKRRGEEEETEERSCLNYLKNLTRCELFLIFFLVVAEKC